MVASIFFLLLVAGWCWWWWCCRWWRWWWCFLQVVKSIQDPFELESLGIGIGLGLGLGLEFRHLPWTWTCWSFRVFLPTSSVGLPGRILGHHADEPLASRQDASLLIEYFGVAQFSAFFLTLAYCSLYDTATQLEQPYGAPHPQR